MRRNWDTIVCMLLYVASTTVLVALSKEMRENIPAAARVNAELLRRADATLVRTGVFEDPEPTSSNPFRRFRGGK